MVNKIAELRAKTGMSQKDLAKELKISHWYLNKIERGKVDPGVKLAVRIARALDTTLNDLFF
ncbi:helix-turn-helix transcriptional regulator [Rossellomorea vietnamensis]|uniref:helix-turn-helix transcriptional regulator n=1 Tax=Rossellomorea vietnamensis TaxID=218284 RepID=UPI0005580D2A|nr:helix-turn-helix transcriptional regulator [Rossellomorea vietnamensis]